MTIYIDLVFLLNLWFDFLLLISVSLLLKRNIKLKRLVFGSLVGSLTLFFLFFKLDNLMLFSFKIFISILMIIITFSFKNIKFFITNITYFYLSSIILGGGMYLITDFFSFSNSGLMFYNNGFKCNYFVLALISSLILFIYIKNCLKLKNTYSNYYKVDFIYKNKLYHLTGFLDTGNNLKDIYKKRNIIIANIKIDYDLKDLIYTPYNTLNHDGILKCLKVDKLYVDKKLFNNYLIGISNEDFKIDGIDCILNSNMKGLLK